MAARLADFDVVVAMRERTPFTRSLLARLPRLRLLVTTGMRNASIDLRAAAERGIRRLRHGGPSLPDGRADVGPHPRAGPPRPPRGSGHPGRPLAGDAGDHAQRQDPGRARTGTARLARGAGRAGVRDGRARLESEPHRRARRGRRRDPGRRARTRSSPAPTSSRSTWCWASAPGGSSAPASSPSCGRPPTWSTRRAGRSWTSAALIAALRAGTIAGAGLDVYDEEPLPPDHPLRRLPNTVITPHLGYVTEETYRIFYPQAVEDVRAFLAGSPVRVLSP